ncbi:uncharacterized protein LOC131208569 [Anopheles bellator]|uniref:uncharacterized protein LOC131208569 n=1 Tax=Anopheles bellator TaxID=139047 RepID=UPI002647B764|nr:uncharacterized protein LOC131208569 [Anopheles bellator]
MHSSNIVQLDWSERIVHTALTHHHGNGDVYRRFQDNDGGSSSSASNDTECTTLLDETCRKNDRLYDFTSGSERHHYRAGGSGCSKNKVFFFVTAVFVFFTLLLANFPVGNDRGRVGTIVGWGLNTSRQTMDYILPYENTTMIDPANVCTAEEPRAGLTEESEKVFLLIVVCSSAGNFEARQTIRQTWGNVRDFNYDQFRFLHASLRGEYLEPKASIRATLKEYVLMPGTLDPVAEESRVSNGGRTEQFLDDGRSFFQDHPKPNSSHSAFTRNESLLLANSAFNIKVVFLVGQSESDYVQQHQRTATVDTYGKPVDVTPPNAATKEDRVLAATSDPAAFEDQAPGTVRSLFPNGADVDPAFNIVPPAVVDELQLRIVNESETHGDIIQESFIDSYNNLTLKTIMMLKWVTNNCDGKVKFLMKCDDDTFVNVPNLVQVLLGGTVPLYKAAISFYDNSSVAVKSTKNRLVEGHHLLTGFLFCEAKPIGDTSSKWYSPTYMYNREVYPNYLSGTAYLMNFEAAKLLYRTSLSTPIFHLEDVYLTGIVADRAKVRRRHHPLFFYSYTKDLCALRGMISQHQLQPSEIRTAFEFIRNGSIVCRAPEKHLTVGQLKLQQRKKCQ